MELALSLRIGKGQSKPNLEQLLKNSLTVSSNLFLPEVKACIKQRTKVKFWG